MADQLTPKPKRSRPYSGDQYHQQEYSSQFQVLISIANETFGLNSWSHSITQQHIDFIDCDNGKYSVGVAALVKVELQNGVHHQEIGYGICNACDSKGNAILQARKYAAVNGLQEALCSFGAKLSERLNDNCRLPATTNKTNTNKTSPSDQNNQIEAVSTVNKHLTVTSPISCATMSEDDLKLERKRRQRQKQEEFLQQLKQKQLTNCKEPEIKSMVEKTVGIDSGEKENDLMSAVELDDDALISTQEMNRMMQSAVVQQSRMPLISSPPNTDLRPSPLWPSSSRTVTNNVPKKVMSSSRRIISPQMREKPCYQNNM
ncbi:DNA repair protein RAD52 homolog [Periplaneta americana]|uniref:DNA repair protein RAD52 homolog n=1 Tax=Periplaneta americana TaxID=6978 RepID=UPI0037E78F22